MTAILLGLVVAVRKNSCEMQQYGVSEVIVIVHRFSESDGGGVVCFNRRGGDGKWNKP